MFAAINSTSGMLKRAEEEERSRLHGMYLCALRTLDIDMFLSQKPQHDANTGLYTRALRYLAFNYTFKKSLAEIEPNISRYSLLDHREALFNIARKCIDAERFIMARKLLNIARERDFVCNALYELEDLLQKTWYPQI